MRSAEIVCQFSGLILRHEEFVLELDITAGAEPINGPASFVGWTHAISLAGGIPREDSPLATAELDLEPSQSTDVRLAASRDLMVLDDAAFCIFGTAVPDRVRVLVDVGDEELELDGPLSQTQINNE